MVALTLLVALVSSLVVWPTAPSGAADERVASVDELCPATVSSAQVFVDVVPGRSHASAIACLHALGIVGGRRDGTFRPSATTTRGHVAIALHALLEQAGQAPPALTAHAFTDVRDDHVARDAIATLAAVGIVQGVTPTTFAPDRPLDRAQVASLLVRTHGVVDGRVLPLGPTFPDTVGTTHEASIRRLVGAGITQGRSDGSYRPGDPLSRGQLASLLYRYLELLLGVQEVQAPLPDGLLTRRLSDPPRTVVEDAQLAWVATFTDGARTVALAGPARRFEEATASHAVTSTTWVRVLPQPFAGNVDAAWLQAARRDRSPDVLATSMQYLAGAPEVRGPDGVLLAADASYGPLAADGTRPVGSDWHDFQGVVPPAGTTTRPAVADRYRSVDCSGFMRLLWGVRFGIPLSAAPDGGRSLPRRATQQASSAPGVVPIRDRGTQVTAFGRLQPGDLVFFDATPSEEIDHVGMYLGRDDAGRHRFVSSRRTADGPTMGDVAGASLLDGAGLYARSFRSSRRL